MVLVNSDGKMISAGGSSGFDQRVLRPNAMLTTTGAVAVMGLTGHPTQTGQYGREGRNGMSGRSGTPGLEADSRIGQVGAVLWQLLDENQRPVATFSSRFHLQVVDFKVLAVTNTCPVCVAHSGHVCRLRRPVTTTCSNRMRTFTSTTWRCITLAGCRCPRAQFSRSPPPPRCSSSLAKPALCLK